MTARTREIFIALIFIGVVSLVILWPLLRPGFFVSDDGEWMIIRLTAFYQGLAEGQFPTRVLGRLNHGYGYAVANFLYPGFLYVGSVLRLLGFSFTGAIKAILFASVLGSAYVLYVWLRRSFTKIASLIGVGSFLYSPYLVFDLYRRGSVGEVFAFFPASLSLLFIKAGNDRLLALSIALLIVAHNSLAFLFLIFFFFYIIFTKRTSLFLSLCLGLMLSAFFWIPAIAERSFVRFDAVTIADSTKYFADRYPVMLVSLPILISSFITLALSRKKLPEDSRFLAVTTLVSIGLSLSIASVVWSFDLVSKIMQFPYRMLAISVIIGPWVVAASLDGMKKARWALVGVFTIVSIMFVSPILSSIVFIDRGDDYYITNEATTTVADEYMPKWVSSFPRARAVNHVELYQGEGSIIPTLTTTRKIDASISARTASVIQINTIFYPGWGVVVDNTPVTIDYDNPFGVMRIPVPAGTHRLVAEFRETPLRFGADAVTLVGGLIWLVMWFRPRRNIKHD